MIRVLEAKVVSDFVVWIRFNDGVEATIDLSNELDGPIFEPLRDPAYFRQLEVNPDIHTITWPNGADFAPEFLYEKAPVPA
jgi:hypothetical protein